VIEDMNGRIDAIIDGGEGDIGLESTIIDFTVSPPQILRPGYITNEMLSDALGERVVDDATLMKDDGKTAPRAPGMKYRHYAPKGELTIVEGSQEKVVRYINDMTLEAQQCGEKTGVIATDEQREMYRADVVKSVGSRNDENSVAKHLYTVLREFDDENVTKIFSESFETDGFGQAIMNRLLKAAGHRVEKLD
jgi:L-threonylcarbamoyladenylate synthase